MQLDNDPLLSQLIENWLDVRSRTNGVLNVLEDTDLFKRLPFESSDTVFNQFYCMIGTTEAFARLIETGSWQGWSSPLEYRDENYNVAAVKQCLQASNKVLFKALQAHSLLQPYPDSKDTPLKHYLTLLEHEAHHLGQLINFVYALDLPIPEALADKWGLSRN